MVRGLNRRVSVPHYPPTMKAFLRQSGLPVLTGILLGISFPSWHIYPLAFVALVPLLIDVRKTGPARTARQFFLAGTVFYLILLHWLATNVYWAGGWALWGYVGLSLFMAAYWAVAGWAWSLLRRNLPFPLASLALAALWTTMEFLQARLFTGFGWGAIAYGVAADRWLLQWAAVGGEGLIAFIVVWFNVLLARTITEPRHRWLRLATALVVLVASHAGGAWLLHPAQYGAHPLKVGVLQADFPLEMKWDPEYKVDMVQNSAEKSEWMARNLGADFIVWPESLVMGDPLDEPELGKILSNMAVQSRCTYFVGSVRDSKDNWEGYNSSFLIEPNGTIGQHYDKIHLAPFGEYVPLGHFLPFIQKVVPAIGSIESGTQPKVFRLDGRRFGPLICFEVLFAPMAETLRSMGANFLVVITNLGWFGASAAIPQELEIARVRAVETRLPIVQAANSGISGIFDPYGRFSVVDCWKGENGTYDRAAPGIQPDQVIMHRMFGVFPLAEAAPRFVPHGAVVFPWIALVITVLFLAVAKWAGRSSHPATT